MSLKTARKVLAIVILCQAAYLVLVTLLSTVLFSVDFDDGEEDPQGVLFVVLTAAIVVILVGSALVLWRGVWRGDRSAWGPRHLMVYLMAIVQGGLAWWLVGASLNDEFGAFYAVVGSSFLLLGVLGVSLVLQRESAVEP